ncbi:MAG: glycosyltransferase family 4 protein [Acidobacteriota bacterium]
MINLLCVDHVTKILGGAELNLLQLLEHIDREQFNVQVACVADGVLDRELYARQLPRQHFQLSTVISEYRLVNRRLALGRALRAAAMLRGTTDQLITIAKQMQAQVLLSVTNKDHFAAGMAARRLKCPSVWWVNDIMSRAFFSPLVLSVFNLMARRYASRLVAVSQQVGRSLLDLGVPADRITTIYNGVDPQLYRRIDGTPLRRALGVPETAQVVTIIGRITPWKGHQIFIDAAAELLRQRDDIYFLVVGGVFNEDQAFAEQLQMRVKEAGLTNHLHFLAFRKDVAEVYSASDIVVHCSLKPEAFGRVLIEAMSCEVPVVAACSGGVEEIVVEGHHGYLVPIGDVRAYVAAIDALLADPLKARTFGRTGRDTVCARFTLDRMVNQFENLLTETVKR